MEAVGNLGVKSVAVARAEGTGKGMTGGGHGVSGSRETRRRERVDAGVWDHVGSEGGSDAHAALSARGWAAGAGWWGQARSGGGRRGRERAG